MATVKELTEQVEALTALMTAQAEQASAPANKTAATKSKATEVRRNLDPIAFPIADDGDLAVTVSPVTGSGRVLSNGSRLYPSNKSRSFTRQEVEYIASNSDEILTALDECDKRAKVGQHLPA